MTTSNKLHCRDLPDGAMCEAIYEAGLDLHPGELYRVSNGAYDGTWSLRWKVQEILIQITGRQWPEKLVLAKFNRMQKRGLVDGCGCGCRGDWQLTFLGELTRTAWQKSNKPPSGPF